MLFKSKRRAFALFVLFVVGAYGLLIPTDIFPVWLDLAFQRYPHLDKLLHAGLFFSVVLLLHWSTHVKRRYLMAFAIIAGAATEVSQHFVEGRSASLHDFLADTSGALTALWLTGLLSVFVSTKRRECQQTFTTTTAGLPDVIKKTKKPIDNAV